MKNSSDAHMRSRQTYFKVSLVFLLLAFCLQLIMWLYWDRTLEPRLRREADSQANVLAHSQAVKLAEVLSLDEPGKRLLVLTETLDEVLLFAEPETGTPFFLGIDLEVDYEAVSAPPGSLDLMRGEKHCRSCFISEVALYSPVSDELLGIARFRVSDSLFQRLSRDVKMTLFTQSLLGLFLLLGVWGVVMILIKAINRSRQEAEIASRAKSTFLANMSHELRTPLNAIIGFSQMISHDADLSSQHKENLLIINRSGEYLLELINDVLELARIESGQNTLTKTAIDLYDTLEKVAEMIRLRAERKNLHLVVERTETVPRYIRTDERKLRQILLNLLGNAVKFTEQGGVTLRVRLKNDVGQRTTNNDLSLCFEVEDTGPGFSPGDKESMFEAFTQAKSGLNKKEGVGLGLAISRQFVHHLGGEIEMDSEAGKGTVFRFTIRAQTAQASQMVPVKPMPRVIGMKTGQGRKKSQQYRILVVDDNAENRMLLRKILAKVGFSVNEAENGQQALQQSQMWRPHLIWMDMRMPVMDGYEATPKILSLTKDWRPEKQPVIIALTASAFEEDRAAVLAAGCHDFVRRPFRAFDIFDMMQKHLGVQYVYEEGDEGLKPALLSEKMSDGNLTASINKLSKVVIARLEEGTELCDAAMIDQVIEDIRTENIALADGLSELAENYAYDKILDLIQKAKGNF